MPRPNAYAITLTKKVQERVLKLLEVAELAACKEHSGPLLHESLLAAKFILTRKATHKGIR